MTEVHREIERKLRVHALFRLPSLAGVSWGVASVDEQQTFTMHNTYFDTADLRLFRWGVTLRRREGGPDTGWHLKLPVEGADGTTRDEVRMPLDNPHEVPWELRDLVTALVREAPLQSIVTLRTERTPYLLLDAEGRATAELVDDTVSVLDGDRVAAIFREIEVEGIAGDDGEVDLTVMNDVVDILVEHGAVPGTTSKAASALGPRTQAPPDVPEPHWPGPKDPAADAVTAFITMHVRRFLLQDVRLRRDLPDAVHQMRVAARRLRSGLQVFRPLIDRNWADGLRSELAWAAGSLGMARDTEVLLERLDRHTQLLDDAVAEQARSIVDPFLQARMQASQGEARALLDSDRYRSLLSALVSAVHDTPFTEAAREPARQELPPLVAKAFNRLRRDVKALSLESPSVEWHEARIAAKRARYAADAVAPVFGKDVERLASELALVTDILGTHQDAHVARLTLEEMSHHASGQQGYALGLLDAVEAAAELDDRLVFIQVWPTVRRTARRSGML